MAKATKLFDGITVEHFVIDVFDVDDQLLFGRTPREVQAFAQQILAMPRPAILSPIVYAKTSDGLVLRDGRKRILAGRYLVDNGHDQFRELGAVSYGLPLEDSLGWQILLNETATVSSVQYFIMIRELQTAGDWEAVEGHYKFNKARIEKVMALADLQEPDLWFEAYHDGNVAETTLFKIAKEPVNRQQVLVNVLLQEGKVSSSDVAKAKRMAVTAQLSVQAMPQVDLASATPSQTLFVVFDPRDIEKINASGIIFVGGSIECQEQKFQTDNGHKMYKLLEVG